MPGERIIERLAKYHNRSSFQCGRAELDEWLKFRSGQFDRRDLARTYVAIERNSTSVLGFYSLSSHSIGFDDLSQDQAKGLPRIAIPAVLLGRLAVDQLHQGKKLGKLLLIDALRRCQTIAEQIGILAVEVHAIDEAAYEFYSRFGFVELMDDPLHLFLIMHKIRRLDLAG
ncbi:MAG: GNAT family N-acetyltransferase [Planctomycetaceae bacterium]